MLSKTLPVCTIFAFCFVRMYSISITSIVRFKCEKRVVRPSQGCVGTYILPTIVLTTSFCAENCQSVGNERIIGSHVHPYYRNYVHGRNFIARNDIALVVTTRVPRSGRKLVKLSALDAISTIGLKALVPIMDDNKPRLQVTLIENCYKEQPFGYYVCATNKITKQSIRVCQERQEQGVPLLLEDRIFGIMGITNTDSCSLSQRSFTAISPALFWISETVRNLGYTWEVISTLHDGDIYNTHSVQQSTTKGTISTMPTHITTTIPPDTDILPDISIPPVITTPNDTTDFPGTSVELISFTKTEKENTVTHQIKTAYELRSYTRKPLSLLNVLIAKRKGFDKTTPKPITTLVPKNISLVMRQGPTSVKTTEDTRTAITFIPSPTLRARTTLKTTVTTRQVLTTNHTIPFFKLTADNKTTNVMDWFNVMVKDKLKNNPSMFYVVSSSTTTTTTRRPKNFIDLT